MSGTNASATSFNIGKNLTVVVIGPHGRVEIAHLTDFDAKQDTHEIVVDRLNGPALTREVPRRWTGVIGFDRGNSVVDDFFVRLENDFWNGLAIAPGTIYEYIAELDGSTSTYQFDSVTFKFTNPGNWKLMSAVNMQIGFSASRRRKV